MNANNKQKNIRMKSRAVLIIIALLVSGSVNYGQIKEPAFVKIKKKEFKTENKEGFDEAWLNIRDGNTLFLQGIGTYSEAGESFIQAHQYNSENAELNYLIGVCYLFTDDRKEAVKYLKKAYDLKPKVSPEINFYLGRAYHLLLEFDKAVEQYNTYLKSVPPDKQAEEGIRINKLIEECSNGKSLTVNRKRVIITNPSDSINSPYDDYLSIFADNDSTIFFTSRRGLDDYSKRNPYDNKFYENAYVSYMRGGKWTQAQLLPKSINRSGNEAVVGIAPDGSALFIYKGKKNGGDIFESTKEKGQWGSPEAISSRLRSDQAETSVFLTRSGDTVYFVSAREDLTLGGKDIFRSVLDKKGKWEKPVNIGSNINTVYDEEGIYITPDGKELYFASRGHNSMGGYDIFRCRLQETGIWGDPENLGYPINTPEDDLFYSLALNGKYAYYTSTREDGIGGKDIYKVIFLGAEKEVQLEKPEILIAGVTDLSKKGFFTLPSSLVVESTYIITGKVLDKKTKAPVTSKLEFIDVGESKVIATGITADSGVYRISLEAPKRYGVEIVARDYMFFLDAVDMTKASPDEPFVKDFFIEKIEVGTKVVLQNIYFETAKAVLTAASYPTLNQVVDFMKSNESLKMEISGHTDNVGSLAVNTKLSANRAKAVVDYLVANGIDRTRLEAKGYGFSQPVAPNNTRAGREKNRRVEFKVISK